MKIPALTSARFIAAIMIPIFHYGGRAIEQQPAWLQNVHGNLRYAVSFFFVLSGYVITQAWEQRPTTIARFYWARFSRIYPVYLIGLLLMITWKFIALMPAQTSTNYFSIKSLVLSLFCVQGWTRYAMTWNYPGWSICSEFFFYLLFPFCYSVIDKISQRSRYILLISLSFGYSVLIYLVGGESYFPPVGLPLFVIGILISKIKIPFTYHRTALLGGIVLFCFMAAIKRDESKFPDLSSPAFPLIIVGLSTVRKGILDSKILEHLGDASYCTYILHVPVILLVATALHREIPRSLNAVTLPGFWLFAGYIIILLVLSSVLHLYVEIPTRKRLLSRTTLRAESQRDLPLQALN